MTEEIQKKCQDLRIDGNEPRVSDARDIPHSPDISLRLYFEYVG